MLRRWKADLAVLVGYAAVSFAYVAWWLVPHPGRLLIGGSTRDPEFFMWSFSWWPHAIWHGMNPFVSHAIYAPTGVNLTWTATAPGLALVFSPVTLLFGPAVAYNVAAVLLPALSAWTAYLLCRHLTSSLWASLVGGYLFGFSSEILLEEFWGNLDITAIFLVPLIALVLVRYIQGQLDGRGLAWRLGVLLAAQLWISEEHDLMSTLALGLGILLASWLMPELRPRLRSSLGPIGAGYALGALFATPFLVFVLIGLPAGGFGPAAVGSDLLDFFVPTTLTAVGGSTLSALTNRFVGTGAYLGLPTLLIIGAFAFRGRRSGATRFLVAVLCACSLIALGKWLYVGGDKLFPLPWRLAAYLPFLEDVFPFRFAAFGALAAAVMVALWTASSRGRFYPRPFVLPVLAAAALVPGVWQSSFKNPAAWRPARPAFFADSLYKTCIPRNETVTIFPFGSYGDSLLYQAETDFWFRMAEDNLQPLPPAGHKAWASFDDDWLVSQFNGSTHPTPNSLLAFAAIHHVDRFVSLVGADYPSTADMRSLGPTERIGGVLVSPACGQPSLIKRDLTGAVQTYLQQRRSQASIDYCLGTTAEPVPEGLEPSGPLQGARPARFVTGVGLTCALPPAGYKHRGFATPDMDVPANTYPLYAP